MTTNNILVLGAGLSGLGFARTEPSSRIFEAADHAGGHAWSKPFAGLHFDQGAHICHAKDKDWLDLLYQQAGEVHQIPRSVVKNYWHGNWFTYPVQNHLSELPLKHRIQLVQDFVAAQIEYKDQTPSNFYEWCLYQYGTYMTDNFYRLFTDKYWRTPMEELGTDWLSGRMLPSQVERIIAGAFSEQEEQQAAFNVFHYPQHGGFNAFFSPLYDQVDISLNKRATAVDPKKRCVTFEDGTQEEYEVLASSIPLPTLVDICEHCPQSVKEAAGVLHHLELYCINAVIRRPDITPAHWFYIYDQDIDIARTSVPSNLAPQSVKEGQSALQGEIFRRPEESVDAEQLLSKGLKDLGRLLDFDSKTNVEDAEIVQVPYSYVISDLKRADAVDTIHSWLREQGIFPMGLYGNWKYVWSNDAYSSGVDTAKKVREFLSAR